MTIDQLGGELVDVVFDTCSVGAWLLGLGDREGRPADHTEAAGGQT